MPKRAAHGRRQKEKCNNLQSQQRTSGKNNIFVQMSLERTGRGGYWCNHLSEALTERVSPPDVHGACFSVSFFHAGLVPNIHSTLLFQFVSVCASVFAQCSFSRKKCCFLHALWKQRWCYSSRADSLARNRFLLPHFLTGEHNLLFLWGFAFFRKLNRACQRKPVSARAAAAVFLFLS